MGSTHFVGHFPQPGEGGSAFRGPRVGEDWEVAGVGTQLLAVVHAEYATYSAFLVCPLASGGQHSE